MDNIETNMVCTAEPTKKPSMANRIVRKVRRWIFLNIWCRYCYRFAMRLLHRFNLHYAPPSPLSPKYGARNHWCQWCGLRGTSWVIDINASLKTPQDDLMDTGLRSKSYSIEANQ